MGLKTASGPVRGGDSTRDDIQLCAVKIRFKLAHKVFQQRVNVRIRRGQTPPNSFASYVLIFRQSGDF